MTAEPPLRLLSRDEAERNRFIDLRPQVCKDIIAAREPVVLVCGPVGTGKTRLVLEHVRACCLKYPRSRWVIARSVRRWLTQSALVTWEEKVLVGNETIPDRVKRDQRSEYRFRNGSRVIVAGLDDANQVMSAEYDGIFVVEATEISRDTSEMISNRLRNNRMPYQQLMMDCNPSVPTHWLNQDRLAGKIRYIEMTHADNPALCDPATGLWTPYGQQYLARLESLTGSRRLRLKDGKWAQSEGVVWGEWSETLHIVPSRKIPADWPRYVVIDFGFTNPLCIQWWAVDGDGRMWLYREIYKTGMLVEDAAQWIVNKGNWGDPRPRVVLCDHDAEDRATFERHCPKEWPRTTKADKSVDAGIQNVAARMKKAGDGRPRLFMLRDARINEPDPELLAAAKPTSTAEEIAGYVWDPKLKAKEAPLKVNDHGCDAMRYIARHLDEKPTTPDNYLDNALDSYDHIKKPMW
jgi:phage terminase large subunit